MTEQPDPKAILEEIKVIESFLDELKAVADENTKAIDKLREELLEVLEEQNETTEKALSEIAAFQKNILEPNQQKIWSDGIGELLKKVQAVLDLAEIEQDAEQ